MARVETRLKLFKQVILFEMAVKLYCNNFFFRPLERNERLKIGLLLERISEPRVGFFSKGLMTAQKEYCEPEGSRL